jgi:3',5'-cyclic AMP phosphodiesterase CpdA
VKIAHEDISQSGQIHVRGEIVPRDKTATGILSIRTTMASESNISIHLLIDLHLEIDLGEGPDYEHFRITPKADILALLGDIGTLNEDRLFRFLRQQTSQFSKVLYLPGNHEFYHCNYVKSLIFFKTDAFSLILYLLL